MARRFAIFGFVLYALLCGVKLARVGWDPSDFVRFGSAMPQTVERAQHLLPRVHVQEDVGHDGMQFWTLARDPLLLDAETPKYLDRPVYRAQRMLYPLACAPWKLGGETSLLWGMILTNLAAIVLGTWASARVLEKLGGAPRGALGYVLNPGVAIAMFIDGCDALALACLLLFVLDLENKRALLWATLAVLAKEPSILAVAGIAMMSPGWTKKITTVAVPALVAGVWGLYVRTRLGWAPRVGELGLPFVGYGKSVRYALHSGAFVDLVFGTLVLAASAFIAYRFKTKRSLLLAGALPFAIMAPFLSFDVFSLMHNVARGFAPAITFLWMDLYLPRDRLNA